MRLSKALLFRSLPLLALLLAFGLGPLAAQSIVASATSGCSPLAANFQVQSAPKPIQSYNWDLGNGNTSILAQPGAIYVSAVDATFNVSVLLTYTDGTTQTVTLGSPIQVFAGPTVAFTASETGGCAPLLVNFTNTTTGNGPFDLQEWEFSQGGSVVGNASGSNPSFSFTDGGSYDVTLLVRDANGCSRSETLNDFITVVDDLDANFTPSTRQETCNGSLSVPFTNTTTTSASGAISYSWDFGNGSTSTQTSPTHNFVGAGNYTVTLTATHVPTGCQQTRTRTNIVRIIDQDIDFTQNRTTGCTPFSVSFSDASTYDPATPSGLTYSWNFGDGATSTSRNPSHTYTTPGTYTVTFTVNGSNSCGGTVTKTNLITVPAELNADFSANQTVFCSNPFTVNFTDNSSGGVTSRTWDFGDGATSTATNPSHTYTAYGTYTVRLTTRNAAGCTDTHTITVQSQPLVPDFTGTPREGCAPQVGSLTSTSTGLEPITSYQWTVTNATTSTVVFTSTAQNPTGIPLNEAGNYDVTLTIGTASGCSETLTRASYFMIGVPPVSMFFEPSDTSICNNDQVSFDNQSVLDPSNPFPIEWTWDYNFNSGTRSPAVNAEGDGNQLYTNRDSASISVQLQYYSNGCTEFFERMDIIVIDWPVARFTADQPACSPDSINLTNEAEGYTRFQWNFYDDGGTLIDSTSSVESPTLSLPSFAGQDITIELIAINDSAHNGTAICTDTARQTITLPALFDTLEVTASDTLVCVDEAINFTTTFNASNYSWDFDGSTGSGQNVSVIYGTPGVRTVRLTATFNGGCTQTDTIDVRVEGPDMNPTADDLEGCAPFLVTFTDSSTSAEPIVSREWFIDGISAGNDISFSRTFTEAKSPQSDTYFVQLTLVDDNGCSVTRTLDILATDPRPDYTLAFDTLCNGIEVTFTGANVDTTGLAPRTYSWNTTASGISIPDGRTQTFTFPEGTHDLELVVTDGIGCQDSITKTFTIDHLDTLNVYFGADDTYAQCPPTVVNFVDSTTLGSRNIASWAWTFGDGTTSVLQSPSKIYTRAGIYTVSLTVEDSAGCSSSFTRVDYIQVDGPFATMSVSDTVGYEDFTVNFSSTLNFPPDSITWDFGDGTLAGYFTAPNISYTYTVPGTYSSNMILKDTFNCTWSPDATTIYVLPCPTLELGPDRSLCENEGQVVLNAHNASHDVVHPFPVSSTVLYRWWENTVAGAPISTDSALTITSAVSTRTFIAEVYLVDGGVEKCSVFDTVRVTYQPAPTAAFIASNECLGTAIQFNDGSSIAGAGLTITDFAWDFGDGNSSTAQNPAHIYTVSGTQAPTLIVVASNACRDTVQQDVVVHPLPTASFTADDACANSPMTFVGSAVIDDSAGDAVTLFEWDFDNDGNFDNGTGANASFTYTVGGVYTVSLRVTTNNGCTDVETHTVNVLGAPGITFAVDTACFGNPNRFDASAVSIPVGATVEYRWDFQNDGTVDLISSSPIVDYTYSNYPDVTDPDSVALLSVITNFGCVGNGTQSVIVRPSTIADMNVTDVCFGDNTELTNTTAAPRAPAAITRFRMDFTNDGVYDYDAPTFTTENFIFPLGSHDAVLEVTTVSGSSVCVDTAMVPVTITPLPAGTIAGTTDICEGDSTDLAFNFTAGTAPYTIIYQDGLGNADTVSNVRSGHTERVAPAATTTYTLVSITDSLGCEASVASSAVITVNPLPNGGLAGTPAICIGSTATISLSLPAIGSYDVVFSGAGITDSLLTNVTNGTDIGITPSSTGSFTISLDSLTDRATGCVRTSGFTGTATITVNPLPGGTIASATGGVCTGESDTLQFNLTGTAPFSIEYFDGTTTVAIAGIADNDTFAIVTPAGPSTTYILSRVQDANCFDTNLDTVVVPVGPLPGVMITGPAQICSGETAALEFAFTGVAPFDVTFTDGTTVFTITGVTDNDTSFVVTPTGTPTTYRVTSVTGNGCTLTGSPIEHSVFVNPTPNGSIAFDATICEGEQVTLTFNLPTTGSYNISVSNGTDAFTLNSVENQDTVRFTPTASGTFNYLSIEDAATGCTRTSGFNGGATVNINPIPNGDILGDATICQGDSTPIVFDLEGVGPFAISIFADSTINLTGINDLDTLYISPSATTTVRYLSIADANGCTRTSAFTGDATVNVQPAPRGVIIGNAAICESGTAVLTLQFTQGTGPFDVTITSSRGEVLTRTGKSSGDTVLVSPTLNTIYRVTAVTDANGCTNSVIADPGATVVVNQRTNGAINTDVLICEGQSATLTFSFNSSLGQDVVYTDGTSNFALTDIFNGHTVSVSPTATTQYDLVSVTDRLSGCVRTDSFLGNTTVSVNPLPNVSLEGDISVCAGTAVPLTFDLNLGTGTYNLEVQVSESGTAIDTLSLTGVADGDTIMVAPLTTTTYTVLSITDGVVCTRTSGFTKAVAVVTTTPAPIAVLAVDTACFGYATTLDATASDIPSGLGFEYRWDFQGDGTVDLVGTDAIVSHTYARPAVDSVASVTIVLSNGCSSTATQPAIVFNNAVAAFTASDVCDGQSIAFSAAPPITSLPGGGAAITDFAWDFGDGTATNGVGLGNTTHAYAAAGTYTVRLVVTSTNGCTDSVSNTVTVNPLPTGGIDGTASICSDGTATLTFNLSGGLAPYNVVFTDGTSNFTINNISNGHTVGVTPTSDATYSLVSITDARGCQATTGFSGSAAISVTNLTAGLVGNGTICIGEDFSFTANFSDPARTYTLVFSGGGLVNQTLTNVAHGQVITVTPPSSGSFTYSINSITDDTQGCTVTTGFTSSATAVVNPLPNGSISVADNNICQGETASLIFNLTGAGPFTATLSNGDVFTNIPNGHIVSVAPTADTTFTLVSVSDNNACSRTVASTASINVNPPPVIAVTASDANVCLGDSATLHIQLTAGTAPFSVTFNDGSGTTFNVVGITGTDTTIMVAPSATGNAYTFTFLEDATGCQVTTGLPAVSIGSQSLPNASIAGTTTICSGETATLTFNFSSGVSPFDVQYSDGTSTFLLTGIVDGHTVTVNPTANTTYTLASITDANGCTRLVDFGSGATVTVNQLPNGNLSTSSIAICEGAASTVTFSATAGLAPYTIVYSEGGVTRTLTDIPATHTFNVTPSETTAYSLISITDANGCTRTDGFGTIATVNVNPAPNGFLSGGGIVCNNNTVDIVVNFTEGTGPFDVVITPSIGSDINLNGISNGHVLPVLPSANTSYTLNFIRDANGCTASSSFSTVTIVLDSLPDAQLLSDTIVCEGQPLAIRFDALLGASPFTVVYTDGVSNFTRTNVNDGDVLIADVLTSDKTYSLVSIADANGCSRSAGFSASATVTASTTTNPNLTLTGDTTMCGAGVAILTLDFEPNVGSYAITVSDGVSAYTRTGLSDGDTVQFLTNATATYTVTSVTIEGTGCVTSVGLSDPSATVTVNAQPVASATADQACFQYATAFDATASTGPITAYHWDFENDGTIDATTTTATTTHLYGASGGFTARLVVETSAGCSDAATMAVTVLPNATAAFTAPNACSADNIIFQNTSTIPVGITVDTFAWDFEFDGVAFSADTFTTSLADVSHFYGTQGTYTAVLRLVSANGCVDTVSQRVVIGEAPQGTLAGTASVCEGSATPLTFTFSAGIAPFTVVYTDGTSQFTVNDVRSGDTVMVTPTAASTTYTLVSIADSIGCTRTDGLAGSAVMTLVPLSNGSVSAVTTTACLGDAVTLRLTLPSIGTYNVHVAGGGVDTLIANATNGRTFTLTPTVPGTIAFAIDTLVDNQTGCVRTAGFSGSATVTVNDRPAVVANAASMDICQGETAAITWELSGTAPFVLQYSDGVTTEAITVTGTTAVVNMTPTVTTTYQIVSLTDANTCSVANPASTTVNVRPRPSVAMTLPAEVCSGDSAAIALQFTGAGPYDVSISDGSSTFNFTGITADTTVKLLPTASPTTYTIAALTDLATGCAQQTGFSTGQVFVNELPNGGLSATTATICAGDTARLTISLPSSGTFDVAYSDGATADTLRGIGNGFVLELMPAATTTYTLLSIVSGSTGCERTTGFAAATAVVTVNDLPNASIASDATICQGDSVQLQFNFTAGVGPFDISFNGDSLVNLTGISNGHTLFVRPSTTTAYQLLSIRDANGCERTAGFGSGATIAVNPAPIADLTGDAVVCDGGTATLGFAITSGAAPYTAVVRDELNGTDFTFSGLNNGDTRTVSPSATTTYTLLSVTDANGCVASDLGSAVIITVNDLSGTITTANDTICLGSSFDFTLNLPSSLPHTAVVTDGTSRFRFENVSNGSVLSITPISAGFFTYTLDSLYDTTNGCVAGNIGSSFTVLVRPLPTGSLSVAGAAVCSGTAADLVFTLAADGPFDVAYTDGTQTFTLNGIANGHIERVAVTANTTFTLLSVTNVHGCTADVSGDASSTVAVTVNDAPSVAIVKGTDPICEGGSTTLTFNFLSGTAPYNLVYTDGTSTFNEVGIAGNTITVNVSPTITTTYQVTSISDANGCTVAVGLPAETVNVTPAPNGGIASGATICAGDSTELRFLFTGTAPFSATYTDDLTNALATITVVGTDTAIRVAPSANATYSLVSVSDATGCTRTDGFTSDALVNVNVLPDGVFNIISGATVCEGETAVLQLDFPNSGPYNVVYTNGLVTDTLLNISDLHQITVTPTAGNNVYQFLSIENVGTGCVRTQDFAGTATITVNPLPVGILDGSVSLCNPGTSVNLTFNFTAGVGPFTVTLAENGAVVGVLPNIVNGSTIAANPSVTTTYSLTRIVDQATGCINVGNFVGATVTLDASPNAGLSSAAVVCQGEQADIVFNTDSPGNAPYSVTYTDGTSTFTASGVNNGDVLMTFVPTADVTFSLVSISDQFGCVRNSAFTSEAAIEVVVPSTVAMTANAGTATICEGDVAVLDFTFASTEATSFDVAIQVLEGGVAVDTLFRTGLSANDTVQVMPSASTTYQLLLATDDLGCSASNATAQRATVTVNPLPVMSLAAVAPTCFQLETAFDASASTGATSYQWDFDNDGTIDATTTVPTTTFAYTEAGTYTVRVVGASGAGCTAAATASVEVLPNATAAFTATNACALSPITLSNTSNIPAGLTAVGFHWDFDYDGTTFGADETRTDMADFTHTYTAAGTYTVALQVELSNGCTHLATQTVVVGDVPMASLSIVGDVVCEGSTTSIAMVISGGIAPYTVVVNDGTQNLTFTNVEANGLLPIAPTTVPSTTYTLVSVADAAGCERTSGFGVSTASIAVATAPVAAFTAPNSCVGSDVVLADASTISSGAIVLYEWDIDNDGTFERSGATLTQVTLSGLAVGSYTSALRVRSNNGCNSTFTTAYEVLPAPTASISAVAGTCAGNVVTFDAVTTGTIAQFEWDFNGDGTFDATGASATNSFALADPSAAQTFAVTLRVTADNGCTATATHNIVVQPTPIVTMTASNTCVSGAVQLSAVVSNLAVNSGWSFTWTLDGQTAAGQQATLPAPTAPGVYNATLVAVSDQGCVTTLTEQVTIFGAPSISLNDIRSCFGQDIVFDASAAVPSTVGGQTDAIVSYTWYFNGVAIFNSASPTFTYNQLPVGATTVRVDVTSAGGCVGTATANVTVEETPVANFTVGAQRCEGNAIAFTDASTVNAPASVVSWAWTFGDGGSSAEQNPTHVYATAGTFTVQLTVSTAAGCSHTISRDVVVRPTPQITLSLANDTICSGNSTNLVFNFGAGQESHLMDITLSDGTVLTGVKNGDTYTVSPTTTTVYSITALASQFGCVANANASATVHVVELPNLAAEAFVCKAGGEVALDATVGGAVNSPTYRWFRNDRLIEGATTGVVTATVDLNEAEATYKVEIGGILCPTTYTVVVKGIQPPVAPLAERILTGCLDDNGTIEVTATGDAAHDYVWSLGGTEVASRQTFFVDSALFNMGVTDNPDESMLYVLVTDPATGCSTADSIRLRNRCASNVGLPNAFTPNGDGDNDVFRPVSPVASRTSPANENMNIVNYQLRIYNRWGEVIYAEQGLTDRDVRGWDGTYLGQPMPSGTYGFIFIYTDEQSRSQKQIRGNVTLLK